MTERAASRTAMGVAILRAAHQWIDGDPKLLADPIAPAVVDAQIIEDLQRHPEPFQTAGARALRSHVVLRSRYTEDKLAEAVASGMDQYLILGAGFDTFAYRQPPWAAGLRIFEVDHPASQDEKRRRLRDAGIPLPSNLIFAPVDFEGESLGTALTRSGFDAARPAFIAWLGVTMYLTLDAIDAVFAWASALPEGSRIVLTFSPSEAPPGVAFIAGQAAKLGEPWLTHFIPGELAERLRGFGFSEVSFLTSEEATARYFGDRTDGLPPPRLTSIAFARR